VDCLMTSWRFARSSTCSWPACWFTAKISSQTQTSLATGVSNRLCTLVVTQARYYSSILTVTPFVLEMLAQSCDERMKLAAPTVRDKVFWWPNISRIENIHKAALRLLGLWQDYFGNNVRSAETGIDVLHKLFQIAKSHRSPSVCGICELFRFSNHSTQNQVRVAVSSAGSLSIACIYKWQCSSTYLLNLLKLFKFANLLRCYLR
jgi:hypothetical protein